MQCIANSKRNNKKETLQNNLGLSIYFGKLGLKSLDAILIMAIILFKNSAEREIQWNVVFFYLISVLHYKEKKPLKVSLPGTTRCVQV